MQARYIFAFGAALFLGLAFVRWVRDGRRVAPACKAWLLVGGIFTVVGIWLYLRS